MVYLIVAVIIVGLVAFLNRRAIKDVLFDFKMRCQRFVRGYADCDVWNINDYFLNIMPKMLKNLRTNNFGYPVTSEVHTQEQWNKILERMEFCFLEANEFTCSKKNKYEDDWFKAHKKFEQKYGKYGRKLLSEEELKNETGIRYLSLMDAPDKEFKDIDKKWYNENVKLAKYRDKMLKEGLGLFVKWFNSLWD